jgi:hypothetical protein
MKPARLLGIFGSLRNSVTTIGDKNRELVSRLSRMRSVSMPDNPLKNAIRALVSAVYTFD